MNVRKFVAACALLCVALQCAAYNYQVLDDGIRITGGSPGYSSAWVIPSEIDGYPVVEIGEKAFYFQSMESIRLPEGLRKIGAEAFAHCSWLKSVNMPKALISIGKDAFRDTPFLKNYEKQEGLVVVDECVLAYHGDCLSRIDLPEDCRVIASGAFAGQTNLEEIVIPDGVRVIGEQAFLGCISLRHIVLPEGIMVIDECAFEGCESLRDLDLPESITEIAYGAFWRCENLSKINFPEGLKRIGNSAFFECSSIESIKISKNVEAVEYEAFKECGNLRSVEISCAKIAGSAFAGCTNLNTLVLKEGVVEIGSHAFADCTELASVSIPDSMDEIGVGAFDYCWKISEIHISDVAKWCMRDHYYETQAHDGWMLYVNDEPVVDLVVPQGVTNIGVVAFCGCTGIKSVVIPEGVEVIGGNAFTRCMELRQVALPQGLKAIDDCAFSGCRNLDVINLSEGIGVIGRRAFSGCESLRKLIIPYGLEEIEGYAFEDCRALERVEIPDSVENIDGTAFRGCDSLRTIRIPRSVKKMADSFADVYRTISDVILPDGKSSIEDALFSDCYGLRSVLIPDSVEEIVYGAFGGCYNLAEVKVSWEEGDRIAGLLSDSGLGLSRIQFVYTTPPPPIFVPVDGTVFETAMKILVTNASAEATTYFTLDGSTPTTNSPVFKKLTITEKTAIKAIAELNGKLSEVSSATYGTGKVETPIIVSEQGAALHSPDARVRISCATAGVEIHFTTNGTQPTAQSPRYEEPLIFNDSVTIMAVAIGHAEYVDSDIATVTLVRDWQTVAPPTIKSYYGAVSDENETTELRGSELTIVLSCLTDGATIRYTTDGRDPDNTSRVYSGPFAVAGTTQVKALAMKNGWKSSPVEVLAVTKIWTNGDVLNSPDLCFSCVGNNTWVEDDKVSHDGCSSLRSGMVDDGGVSVLRTTVSGAGFISFWWKVSCEKSDDPENLRWDHAAFLVGDEELTWIDGDGEWSYCEFLVEGLGVHELSWRYYKDVSDYEGGDCVWVDEVRWRPMEEDAVVVRFDSVGGVCECTAVSRGKGDSIGVLPVPVLAGYEFLGWFTAAVGGSQVTAVTVVTTDVTFYAQWKRSGETPLPQYGPWGEAEAVKNPDKLGPTMLTDMTLELNGAAGAVGDVVAAFRGDTGALCGLGKVMDESGTLTMACYAPTGVKLHCKVWVAASGIEEPVVVDCDAKSDLTAPTSGAFLSGHALVVSDDKDLTISLGSADWHTVSFNVLPADPSPAAVFGSVKAKIAAVTQGIEFWMPGKASSLKAIEIGKGYWVNTKVDDVEWTVSGKSDPKTEIALEEGWNLVGYAPETEGAVQAVLKTSLAAKAVDYVTYGVEFYPGGTLKKMEPGKAYWVHAKKAWRLVYDEVGTQVKAARVLSAPRGEDAAGTALEPTYGPWGESEAVKNPDKLGPTFLTDMAVEIDGEPAEYGDVVAVFRGDTGALCGLGKVMDDSGTLTVVCYAPKGVTLNFKVWLAESGMDEPVIVKCDKASNLVAPESGAFYDGHAISASTEESAETIVTGEKVAIETEFVGYKAVGLPSGLKYDAKTGKITGAAKAATAAEGVVVKFTKKGAEDEELTIVVRAEEISAGCEGLSSGPLPAGVAGAAGGMDIQVDSEGGTKSVSVTKLPSGMKYDSKSGKITGAPTKAGDYEVVLTVTTAYGNKETVKIPVSVAAMPVMAVGTFSGFVSVGEDNLGTVTLTTTDAGKLTAKVITAAGTVSFSGTCWDAVEDGVYRATLTTKTDEKLTLMLDSTVGWDANQLVGSYSSANGRTLDVTAQRNAFGKTWYFAATGDETAGWKFAYTEDTKGAALTVTLKADGSTSIAGALPNGTDAKGKAVTIKVSTSGYANVGGLKDGAIMADFAPVLTVNKVKTVLAIKTNLWFDRTNDHAEGAGDARFVK